MRLRLILPLSLAAWAPLSGCQRDATFECTDNDGCSASGVAGTCEPTGYCSFPDMRCPSGWAYGNLAGDGLAGMCVDPGDTGSGTSTTAPATTVDVTSLPTTTLSSSSTNEPTTSSGPMTATTEAVLTGSSSTSSESCGRWWDVNWPRRVTLSYSRQAGAEALADFPLLVALDPTRIDYSQTRPGGEDIRILLPGDDTPLPIERHVWRSETDERSIVWVRLPQLHSRGGELHLYYGNANASETSNPSEVYFGPLTAVSHNDGNKQLLQPGRNVSCTGDTAVEPGVIGDVNIGGMTCFAVSEPLPLQQTGTASFWIRRDDAFAADQTLVQFGRRDAAAMPPTPLLWSVVLAAGGTPRAVFRSDGVDGLEEWLTILPNLPAAQWHHLAITHDDGAITFYFDGEALQTAQITDGGELPSVDATERFFVGRAPLSGGSQLDGAVDEFRYSESPRSAAWLAAEYASDRDELLTYDVAEEFSDCHVTE